MKVPTEVAGQCAGCPQPPNGVACDGVACDGAAYDDRVRRPGGDRGRRIDRGGDIHCRGEGGHDLTTDETIWTTAPAGTAEVRVAAAQP